MAKKILVVDDDAMNLKMAEIILKKESYEVLRAESGAVALDVLSKEPVDLILLDLRMPVMDGIETLKRIRESEEQRQVGVLLLSASEEESEIERAVELGALGCVKKPFLPKDLLGAVEDALQKI